MYVKEIYHRHRRYCGLRFRSWTGELEDSDPVIEAYQSSYPDWGIAVGTGGDGQYYRFSTGLAQFLFIPGGDTSFTLK